jgi:hypothetical protein
VPQVLPQKQLAKEKDNSAPATATHAPCALPASVAAFHFDQIQNTHD